MRRRQKADGLPFRVYERFGSRTYSIGHKDPSGRWSFRLKCDVSDPIAVAKTRHAALQEHLRRAVDLPARNDFAALTAAFFQWQTALPAGATSKRAASTLAENRREAANLVEAFGKMAPAALLPTHAYQYLQICETKSRGPKGNKEIALAQVILEYGVRTGVLPTNPFAGVKKLKTTPSARLVTAEEMALARRVGAAAGGVRQLVALALYTGYLCVRRSTEVLSLRWSQVVDDGILWTASKQRSGAAGRQALIAWSDELRATIDAARLIKRDKDCTSQYVFGNLRGERYTKGGWKKTLSNLMADCVEAAEADGIPFKPFSLQDCRPMGVTERKSRGDLDVMDATLHTSDRMINRHYDRRKIRHANATE